MIRIEDITKSTLSGARDSELVGLRMRCIQLYDKDIAKESKGFESGRLNRPDFIQKYKLLSDEMTTRGLKKGTQEIDRAVFKSSMNIIKNGIDVPALGRHVVVENIAVAMHPVSKDATNVAFDTEKFNLIEEIVKAEVSRLVESQIGKSCFLYTLSGDETCVPLFDLVLESKLQTVPISKPFGKAQKSEKSDKPDAAKFEKEVKLFSIEKKSDVANDQYLVCGVVYEPDVADLQNDEANEDEIRKAAHQFMEEVQIMKVNHAGKQVKVKPVESYIAPTDFEMCGQKVKKGSWVMTCKVNDEDLWKDIKDNKITGYSMAGYARTE